MGSITRLFTRVAPLVVGCSMAHAFSLVGDFEAWQAGNIGYNPGNVSVFSPEGDVVAPKDLNQEFRINQPILTYGFDQSFIEFMGPVGVKAVDDAFKVFNDLPPVSQFSDDLAEFPRSSARVNYTAQRLSLLDVKSITMGLIMEQLGLTSPERYVWTIRQMNEDNGQQYYRIVNRNFDPITWLPTPYVNDTLYTYRTLPFIQNGTILYYDAQEISLDASEPNVTVAAYAAMSVPTIDGRVSRQLAWTSYGTFFTGLTRDDAGGLRYLYRPSNRNWERLPASAFPVTQTGVDVIGDGGGQQGNWSPFIGFISNTNTTTTNIITASVVDIAQRPGVDKIRFQRVDMDPLLNIWRRPVVVRYTDNFTTNGVSQTQRVERQLPRPDIIFTAADLGNLPAPRAPYPYVYTRQVQLVNNFDINTIDPASPTADTAGPGVIDHSAGVVFGFNRVSPGYINIGTGTTEEAGRPTFVWGSFDGTTNAPVAFPAGRISLRELERLALGGN